MPKSSMAIFTPSSRRRGNTSLWVHLVWASVASVTSKRRSQGLSSQRAVVRSTS
ncbi:hypothetical protein D3C87_1834290 [compost metagenome]